MLLYITNFFRKNILLITVLVLAFFLRIIYLDKYPPSLNWDEISHGFNAYSVLKTGKDEWGQNLPLIFRAYGDYKLPVYIYTTVLSIKLFGLNFFSVRLPSVLAGFGSVFFTYFIVSYLFRDKVKKTLSAQKLAPFFAALFVAVEPWSLFLSRGAFEANLALFLFLGGLYFFLRSFNKNIFLLPSAFFFGLSVWTYNSYRVFTPLIIFSVIFLFYKNLKKILKNSPRIFYSSVLILLFFMLPMFLQLSDTVGQARFSKVSIIDEGAISQIIESRINSPHPEFINRILYNRPIYFLSGFFKNWISHFSPYFLFFEGGSHYQFSIPGHGLIYFLNLPFFVLGLVLLIAGALHKKKNYILLLIWFLIAPIPSSLTREAPHTLRFITMLPVPMILTSLGCSWLFSNLKGKFKFLFLIYSALLLIFVGRYISEYINDYSKDYSWAWQYGYKETTNYVMERYDDYEKIIVTKKYGEPHEFILFYSSWDPNKYQNDPSLLRFYQSGWYWVDGFDKFYFVNDWEIPKDPESDFILESGGNIDCANSRCLLITSPKNYPEGWNLMETVYFLDESPAFEILEN